MMINFHLSELLKT
jgi:hypothetical protein